MCYGSSIPMYNNSPSSGPGGHSTGGASGTNPYADYGYMGGN